MEKREREYGRDQGGENEIETDFFFFLKMKIKWQGAKRIEDWESSLCSIRNSEEFRKEKTRRNDG